MIHPISVIHVRQGGGIAIGRKTALGNPFHLRNESDRAAVVEGYRRYLACILVQGLEPDSAASNVVAGNPSLVIATTWTRPSLRDFAAEFMAIIAIARHRPVNLACYCAPKPCHGDPLARAIAWFAKEKL